MTVRFSPAPLRRILWAAGLSLIPTTFAPAITLAIAAEPFDLGLAEAGLQGTSGEGILVSQATTDQVIYVDSRAGNDSNLGTFGTPVRTITQAIANVRPGMVIQLVPGTYSAETGEQFPLEIPQGVTLRGSETSQGQGIEIIGGGRFLSRTQAGQSVAVVLSQGAQVKGVSVSNPNTRGTGIWVEGVRASVLSSTLSGSHREGLFLAGNADVTVQNSIFYQNGGNGIAITKGSRGLIAGNVFESTGYGLAIGDRARPTLQNNRIINNRDGVVINGFAQPILRGNTIENNQNDGVVVIGDAVPDLGTASSPGANQIQNNGRNAVFNATRDQIQFPFYGNTIDGPAPEQVASSPVPELFNSPAQTTTPVDNAAPAPFPAATPVNDPVPVIETVPVEDTTVEGNNNGGYNNNEDGGWINDGGFFEQ